MGPDMWWRMWGMGASLPKGINWVGLQQQQAAKSERLFHMLVEQQSAAVDQVVVGQVVAN